MAALLDTCVLIDVLRAAPAAMGALQQQADQPFVCGISQLELLAGARTQREEARIDRLLSLFKWAAFNPSIYRHAGSFLRHYRASHGLDVTDALIAATADHYGLDVLTLNVKHFPMFARLKAAY